MMNTYPTNPELMSKIKPYNDAPCSSALYREGVNWFRRECLPVIAPSISADRWSRKVLRSQGYAGAETGITTAAAARAGCPAMDHGVIFRYGRKRVEILGIGMPYREPDEDYYLGRLGWCEHQKIADLELTILPEEWSWWFPGRTKIVALALPGVVVRGWRQ